MIKREPRIYYNALCLKCKIIEKIMVMVGPMVFCEECYEDEFKDCGIDTDHIQYKKWIKIYKESA